MSRFAGPRRARRYNARMRHLLPTALLAFLCACDEPGDSQAGARATCEQGMTAFCAMVERTGGVSFQGEGVSFATAAECYERLGPLGTSVVQPVSEDEDRVIGCEAARDGIDWEACIEASSADADPEVEPALRTYRAFLACSRIAD